MATIRVELVLAHFETPCAVGAPLRMTTANRGQKILLANCPEQAKRSDGKSRRGAIDRAQGWGVWPMQEVGRDGTGCDRAAMGSCSSVILSLGHDKELSGSPSGAAWATPPTPGRDQSRRYAFASLILS